MKEAKYKSLNTEIIRRRDKWGKKVAICPLEKWPTEVLLFKYKSLRMIVQVLEKLETLEDGTVKETFCPELYNSHDWVYIDFEGMHWEGLVKDLKKELDRRPHIGSMTHRNFRLWKKWYLSKERINY